MSAFVSEHAAPDGDDRLRRLVRRLAGDKRLLQRRLTHLRAENDALDVLLDAAWSEIERRDARDSDAREGPL
jgi:alkylation response protein AidB-like acyl-CoA dehydrogenase